MSLLVIKRPNSKSQVYISDTMTTNDGDDDDDDMPHKILNILRSNNTNKIYRLFKEHNSS